MKRCCRNPLCARHGAITKGDCRILHGHPRLTAANDQIEGGGAVRSDDGARRKRDAAHGPAWLRSPITATGTARATCAESLNRSDSEGGISRLGPFRHGIAKRYGSKSKRGYAATRREKKGGISRPYTDAGDAAIGDPAHRLLGESAAGSVQQDPETRLMVRVRRCRFYIFRVVRRAWPLLLGRKEGAGDRSTIRIAAPDGRRGRQ